MKKLRLDLYLSEKGLSKSREKAKKEIIAGWVKVNGETIREPSKTISPDSDISIERPRGDFVSRGGEKLSKALSFFNITIENLITADLGASTGGFTDCMLKNGAQKVYAVDVGYGQLDYSLRQDSRVVVMERTNVKNLTGDVFKDEISFISADLSFISILSVFKKIMELFPLSKGIILIKPQFEAEKSEQKKGVVRKRENHLSILKRVLKKLQDEGMPIEGFTFSPIKGPSGNIEFLLYFDLSDNNCSFDVEGEVNLVVNAAHNELNG